jgi:hypothetical protein
VDSQACFWWRYMLLISLANWWGEGGDGGGEFVEGGDER